MVVENIIIIKKDMSSKKSREPRKKETLNTQITYKEYFQNRNILSHYKIPDLKLIAKNNQLHVSGTKPVLLNRIQHFFDQSLQAIIIQKAFRKFIIKLFFKLKGPAFYKKSLCVNETDFYTLEPLDEIQTDSFFSFKDSNDFIYGLNLFSIVQYFIKKGNFVNPYNREKLNIHIIHTIFSLYYKTIILFPNMFDQEPIFKYNEELFLRNYYRNIRHRIRYDTKITATAGPSQQAINQSNQPIMIENRIIERIHREPENNYNQNRSHIIHKLNEIRNKSINNRIQELFMEIDLLGNYTQSIWFSALSKGDYIIFIRFFHQYWLYRARIPFHIKQKICILGDPFHNINLNFNENEISIDECREHCLFVMENLIHGGETDEYRRLGTLHILSALTVVSIPARNAMIWLFEGLP